MNVNYPLKTVFDTGSLIGEVGFFTGSDRSATVTADTNSSLMFLNRIYFNYFKNGCPVIHLHLKNSIMNYKDQLTIGRRRHLRHTLHYLRHIPNEILSELVFSL